LVRQRVGERRLHISLEEQGIRTGEAGVR